MRHFVSTVFAVVIVLSVSFTGVAQAATGSCKDLPGYEELKTALKDARGQANGGLNLNMWGTIVDRSGIICAVAFTGEELGDQWPGSRVISAQKANTANAFSLDSLALSTANLYSATQPGGSLFGLQQSNPVDVDVAYKGPASAFGTSKDPMVGKAMGGVNVFGGGLALYNEQGKIIGGLGVSGDTSCADHNIAWRTRNGMKLDYVTSGVSSVKNDQIIYDIASSGKSAGGFGHPKCIGSEPDVAKTLVPSSKVAIKAP